MMQALTLVPKIAFFPLWILWKGYTGLWWAFDDEPGPRKVAEVGQDKAFQAVDSRPPARPKPLTALRLGFAASIIGSLVFGVITSIAAEAGGMSPRGAGFAWIWASAALFVGSVWGIRRAQRRKTVTAPARGRFWSRGRGQGGRGQGGAAQKVAAGPVPGPQAAAEGPRVADPVAPKPENAEAARGAWACRCDKAKAAALTAGSLAASGCKNASKACATAYKVARPGVKFAWGRLADKWKTEAAKHQVSRGQA
jgi:hypothetical protein